MTDISHPDQRRLFLKAKSRELIAEFGVEAAAEITGRSTSTVSRWQHPDTHDYAPIDCIALLQVACGRPIVSESLFRLHTAEQRAAARAGTCAPAPARAHEERVSAFSQLAAAANDLNTSLAIAISDGQITPGECQQGLKLIADTRRNMEAMERVLVKGAGNTGPRAVPTQVITADADLTGEAG